MNSSSFSIKHLALLLTISFGNINLIGQQLDLEWNGNEADVLSFTEGGLQRFAIEGHTASITDRITFKIRGLDALTFYQGGSIGIGTLLPHSSALLDLSSTSSGILFPRMTSIERMSIGSAAIGLMVYDIDTGSPWHYNSTGWRELGSGSGGGGIGVPGSNRLLDTDGDTKVDVEENPNEDLVRVDLGGVESLILTRTNGTSFSRLMLPNNDGNLIIGENSLTKIDQFDTGDNENNTVIGSNIMTFSNGFGNVAIGNNAMENDNGSFSNVAVGRYSLQSSTYASENVAVGVTALQSNSTGSKNTAIGLGALKGNITSGNNTAVGFDALRKNTVGGNTAVGASALSNNIDGLRNSALGSGALVTNISGNDNTAVGDRALLLNTGSKNTAIGSYALLSNRGGSDNVAIGFESLRSHFESDANVAIGGGALFSNFNAPKNTAVGHQSLYNNRNQSSTAIGYQSLFSQSTGGYNTALGESTGYNNNGQLNVFIGYKAGYSELGSNKLHLANNANESLLYGEFDNKLIKINGEFITEDNDPEHVVELTNVYDAPGGDGIKIVINRVTTSNENEFITFANSSGVQGKIQGQGILSDISRDLVNDLIGVVDEDTDPAVSTSRNQQASGSNNGILELITTEYGQGLLFMTIEFLDAIVTVIANSFSVLDPDDFVWSAIHFIIESQKLWLYIATEGMNAGISYESGGADYAEWLPKSFPNEVFMPGDVVGVVGGGISKTFLEADKFMVISHQPLVIGNMPIEEDLGNFQKVAFLGQTPVKTIGKVRKSDYILPSGNSDGFAIGVHKSEMKAKDYGRIIGIAWSDSDSLKTINLINTAVGINSNDMSKAVDQMQSVINQLQLAVHKLDPSFELNLFDVDNPINNITGNSLITSSESLDQIIGSKMNYAGFDSKKFFERRVTVFSDIKKKLQDQGFDFELFPHLESILNDPTEEKLIEAQMFYQNAIQRCQDIAQSMVTKS